MLAKLNSTEFKTLRQWKREISETWHFLKKFRSQSWSTEAGASWAAPRLPGVHGDYGALAMAAISLRNHCRPGACCCWRCQIRLTCTGAASSGRLAMRIGSKAQKCSAR